VVSFAVHYQDAVVLIQRKTTRNLSHDSNGAQTQTRNFQDTKLSANGYTATSNMSIKTSILSPLPTMKDDKRQALYMV
jgi:hypothetical protein